MAYFLLLWFLNRSFEITALPASIFRMPPEAVRTLYRVLRLILVGYITGLLWQILLAPPFGPGPAAPGLYPF